MQGGDCLEGNGMCLPGGGAYGAEAGVTEEGLPGRREGCGGFLIIRLQWH